MKTQLTNIASVEELDPFRDDYVYDLEMEDNSEHTFFANDILVHNSCGFSIEDIRQKLNFELIDVNGDLTPEFNEIDNRITSYVNIEINKWAIDKLNSKNARYSFKRESVCPKAIWVGKKTLHYVYRQQRRSKNE